MDVDDPSDWNSTAIPSLSLLDSHLRCQICKDWLNAPMMTGCGHTFCSGCIRRALAREQRCPLCRAQDTSEMQLRKNQLVEDIVESFTHCRDVYAWFCVNCRSSLLSKLKGEVIETVECPVCCKGFSQDDIQSHVEKCLSKPVKDVTEKVLRRKPKINYGLLKESALRRELEKEGLPSTGDKSQMIRRHQEWLTLWNGNTDSSKPKSIERLRQELKEWEGAQSRRVKEEISESWGTENRKEYMDLVSQAKKKRKR